MSFPSSPGRGSPGLLNPADPGPVPSGVFTATGTGVAATAGSSARSGTAVTTAVPFLSVFGTAAKRSWIVGVRVDVILTTAAAGNNVTFALNRCSTATVPTSPVSLRRTRSTASGRPNTRSTGQRRRSATSSVRSRR